MRVFVAGATGMIGQYLVPGLTGASGLMLEVVRKRQMPVVGGGTGIWSFTEVTDAVWAEAFKSGKAA